MVLDGTFYFISRNLSGTDTTGTYGRHAYSEQIPVNLSHVGNSYIEVNSAIWEKDGKKISFVSNIIYPPDYPGGGSTLIYNRTYNGTIISNTLIEGDFYIEELNYFTNPKPSVSVKSGRFTIKKN